MKDRSKKERFMKRYSFLFAFFTFFLITAKNQQPVPVVCTVPVANLSGEPLGFKYDALPSDYYKSIATCPRLHQMLFNERALMIRQQGKNILIEIPTHFYQLAKHGPKICRFWTEAQNFTPISALGDAVNCIPETLDFHTKSPLHAHTITLKQPFYSCTTNTMYSAGTRFLVNLTTNSSFTVCAYNPRTRSTHNIVIPASHVIPSQSMPRNQRIQTFIKVLKEWAHNDMGKIPYVWGGCSHNFVYPDLEQVLAPTPVSESQLAYTIKDHKPPVHSGFDCAGLVSRAAQIAGLPYHFKNTVTIGHNLRPVHKHEPIEDGDLVLIPGHVLVISDAVRNTAIEARTKGHGYGYVHEVPVRELFRGICTFEELRSFMNRNSTVTRIDKDGKTIAQVPVKILKMKSIYE